MRNHCSSASGFRTPTKVAGLKPSYERTAKQERFRTPTKVAGLKL